MTISTERLRLDDEETRFALTGAAQAFCNRGLHIACPWEGDMDDEECERFDALVAAIETYNALASRSGVEGREAVHAGEGGAEPVAWRDETEAAESQP